MHACRFVELRWAHLWPVITAHIQVNSSRQAFQDLYQASKTNFRVSRHLPPHVAPAHVGVPGKRAASAWTPALLDAPALKQYVLGAYIR